MAALQQAQERRLRDALRPPIDRLVRPRPVHRQAEMAPQVLERFFVLDREPRAELDEIRTRDRDWMLGWLLRRGEPRVVRQRRIAPHTVVVLHAPLGGKAVVVPPHRVENLPATHPLVARDDVGVREGKDVAHVKRAAHGWRRGVDRIDRRTRLRAIESTGSVSVPAAAPLLLESLERGLLRHLNRARQIDSVGHVSG